MTTKKRLKLLLPLLIPQLLIPLILIIVYQQIYLQWPEVIVAHLLVILFFNLTIICLGLFLFTNNRLKKYLSLFKYVIALLFAILNVVLYFTYLFSYLGQHFTSRIFTINVVVGYLKNIQSFIDNFSLSPVLIYSILILIPVLIILGFLSLRNKIYNSILIIKDFIGKHNFNNPPARIRFNIISFLILFGLMLGIVITSNVKIAYKLFAIEEPLVTVYFKNNDPLSASIIGEKNEDIGVREAYPKNQEFDRKNVIVIIVDALRSDHMGLFGYSRNTSPFLDSLYTTGNLRKIDLSLSVSAESFPGINAILRSKIYSNLGYNNFSLQQLLKDQGYEINFIVSGDHTNFNGLRSFYGNDNDLDYYFDGSLSQRFSDPNDDRLIFEGLEKVDHYDGSSTYFHFHLMSAHNLGFKLNKFKRYIPADISTFDAENYTNRYDNGILQADDIIKKIFNTMSNKGYLKNSIVVITGDHGEALGKDGKYGHGRSVYTDQLITPILIYDTDNFIYKNQSFATLVDIAPTIIDRLGLQIPDTWEGVSLFSESENRQLTFYQQKNMYAIIHSEGNNKNKLIHNSITGQQELYEINSDLYEENNLIDSLDKPYVNKLLWYMKEFNLDVEHLYR